MMTKTSYVVHSFCSPMHSPSTCNFILKNLSEHFVLGVLERHWILEV